MINYFHNKLVKAAKKNVDDHLTCRKFMTGREVNPALVVTGIVLSVTTSLVVSHTVSKAISGK